MVEPFEKALQTFERKVDRFRVQRLQASEDQVAIRVGHPWRSWPGMSGFGVAGAQPPAPSSEGRWALVGGRRSTVGDRVCLASPSRGLDQTLILRGLTLDDLDQTRRRHRLRNSLVSVTIVLVEAGLHQEIEQRTQLFLQLKPVDDHVDHAVVEQIFRGLKVARQAFADGLLDHPASGKADLGSGFRDRDITEHREGCGDAAGGGIGEDGDVGKARLLDLLDRDRGARHLHQGQAPLPACAPRLMR